MIEKNDRVIKKDNLLIILQYIQKELFTALRVQSMNQLYNHNPFQYYMEHK